MPKQNHRSKTTDRIAKQNNQKVSQAPEPKIGNTTKIPFDPCTPSVNKATRDKDQPRISHKNEASKGDTTKELTQPHIPSRGVHHCPYNGAKPHTLNTRVCLRKKHVGYCAICGVLSCYRAGCMHHRSVGAKDENLFTEDTQELYDIVARNKAFGVLGPSCKVPHKFENGRVVILDEKCKGEAKIAEDEAASEDIFDGMEDSDNSSEQDASPFWD